MVCFAILKFFFFLLILFLMGHSMFCLAVHKNYVKKRGARADIDFTGVLKEQHDFI